MVTAKKPATPTKRRVVKPKVEAPKVEAPKSTDMVGRITDLIKWVDSPFKLFTVILLSFLAFAGYFAWDSRQVILHAIQNQDKMPQIAKQESLVPVAQSLMKDLDAVIVVVNKANLVTNSRTTVLAIGPNGREKSLEGTVTSLFNASVERNQAMVAMLNGEVLCEKFDGSSKVGEWGTKNGVTFMCRGSIPPEVGKFAGYIAVGFKEKPEDITAVKTRINLAATDMSDE
jgi:hypothetical protein